jgi:hypothetical protein
VLGCREGGKLLTELIAVVVSGTERITLVSLERRKVSGVCGGWTTRRSGM